MELQNAAYAGNNVSSNYPNRKTGKYCVQWNLMAKLNMSYQLLNPELISILTIWIDVWLTANRSYTFCECFKIKAY